MTAQVPPPRATGVTPPRDGTGRVVQRGRAKVYRPLPAAERTAALQAALDAWDRGDFFLAHELLEPAWMGTADPGERDLYQGLIKLSAGYVHAVRGNPAGVAANLRGARDRLASAARDVADGTSAESAAVGLDLATLLTDLDDRLATAESMAAAAPVRGPRRAGEPARPAVPIEPPRLGRPAR